MIEVILDASIFAIPNASMTADEAVEIISSVQEVYDWLLKDYPVVFCAHSDFDNHLATLYPDIDSISEFLDMTGLAGVYSARDVYVIYTGVIQRITRLDADHVGEAYSFSDLKCNHDLSSLGPSHLVEAMKLTVATCAYRVRSGLVSVVSSPAPWNICGIQRAAVTGLQIRRSGQTEFHPLLDIEEPVQILFNLNDIFDSDLSDRSWKCATSAEDIYTSIWIGAAAHSKRVNGEVPPAKNFRVGGDFFDSARLNQCANFGPFSSTTLKTCIYYLCDPTAVSRKVFRGIEKRTIDQATAYRSHITKGNPALRLLTWEGAGGEIEFANVGPKHELRISAGSGGGEYPPRRSSF